MANQQQQGNHQVSLSQHELVVVMVTMVTITKINLFVCDLPQNTAVTDGET